MRKTSLAVLAVAAAAALAPFAAQAGGGVSVAISTADFGIRIGAPMYGPRVIAPVMVPAPVVMPAPVVVAQPRVVYAPVMVAQPVVVAPVVMPRRVWVRPVVVAPRGVRGPVVVHPRHGWTPPPRVVMPRHHGRGHDHRGGHPQPYYGPQQVAYQH